MELSVTLVSHISAAGTETSVDYTPGGVYAFTEQGNASGGIHLHVQSSVGSGKHGWQAGNVSYGSSFGASAFLSALTGAGITAGDARYIAAQEFAPGTLDYTGEKDWFDSQWFTLKDGEKILGNFKRLRHFK